MNQTATSGNPASAVAPPAVCLLGTALLGLAFQLFLVVPSYFSSSQRWLFKKDLRGHADPTDELVLLFYGVLILLVVLVNAFVAVAALQAVRRKSYGISRAGAVLALLPCLSPLCIAGMPFAIWLLVVLRRPAVRTAFR